MGRERDQELYGFVAGRFDALRRTAYLMCGDRALADALTSAALADLVAGDRGGGPQDWDVVARRALMNAFTTGWWRPSRRRERVFSGDSATRGGRDPVVQIAVLAALSRLPARRRAVVVLRHWAQLSVFETADVLGSGVRAVVAQEARGLAMLRDALGGLLPPAPDPQAPGRLDRRHGGRHAGSRHAASRRRRLDDRRVGPYRAVGDTGLHDLLARVLDEDPGPADAVPQVFGRAERLRRRRIRSALAAGACTVVLAALGGIALTEAVPSRVLPATPMVSAAAVGWQVPSGVAAAVAAEGLRLGTDRVGVGWRRYTLVEPTSVGGPAGRPRGTLQLVTYTTPGGMCFPARPGAPGACAHAEHGAAGIEFVRYSDDDAAVPFHQVIARRTADGRTVAVIAAGPSDAGSAAGGPDPVRAAGGPDPVRAASGEQTGEADTEPGTADLDEQDTDAGSADAAPMAPPLSARQVVELATDPTLADTFGAAEWCDRVDPGCPELRVPLVDGTP